MLTVEHVAEEFLKEELLKIQYNTIGPACLKIVTKENFYFLYILCVTCLWPLGTNEINYLHLQYQPPSATEGERLRWGLEGSVICCGEIYSDKQLPTWGCE